MVLGSCWSILGSFWTILGSFWVILVNTDVVHGKENVRTVGTNLLKARKNMQTYGISQKKNIVKSAFGRHHKQENASQKLNTNHSTKVEVASDLMTMSL